jgi:uncharacterized protein (TIGR02453 family)
MRGPQGSRSFGGFGPASFAFLRDLAANQTKAWFEANRAIYEREMKQPLGALADALAAEFDRRQVPLTGDAKRSLFRINRDVRFSKDKSPYKTNGAVVWFRPGSSKDGAGVLYFHLADSGCFAAAVFYLPDKDVLESLREGIRVRPDSFLAMQDALGAKKLAIEHGESLSRMPRGFEDMADSPVAPYLKLRSLIVRRPLSLAEVADAGLVKRLAGFAEDAMPLLQFGWRAVDEVSAG